LDGGWGDVAEQADGEGGDEAAGAWAESAGDGDGGELDGLAAIEDRSGDERHRGIVDFAEGVQGREAAVGVAAKSGERDEVAVQAHHAEAGKLGE
jgi:hypothetical protein